MRSHSTRAALRALRSATSAQVASIRAPPARALCIQVPPAVQGAAGADTPVITHATSDPGAVIPEGTQPAKDPAPVASVLEAAPESDATADLDDCVAADGVASAEELDVVLDDSSEQSTAADETSPPEGGWNIDNIKTPGELLSGLIALKDTNVRQAMHLFRAAVEQEGSPLLSAKSVRMFLPVTAKHSWWSTAQDAFDVAQKRNFEIGLSATNHAFYAMTKTGNIKKQKEAIERMLSTSQRLNVNSFNFHIACHIYTGDIDGAFDVLQTMKAARIRPVESTYYVLVLGCLRRKEYHRAHQTLIAAEQHGFFLNASVIAQVLHEAAVGDNCDDLPQLMARLEDSLSAYGSVVDRVAVKRKFFAEEKAKTGIYRDEKDRGNARLELSALNAVMHAAFRGGRHDIALQAWNVLSIAYPERPHTADHWYSLIGALAAAGEFSAAFDAVSHMRAAGITPSMLDLTNTLTRPLSTDVAKIDEQYFRLLEHYEGRHSPASDVTPKTETVAPEAINPAVADAPEHQPAETANAKGSDTSVARLDEDIAKNLSSSEHQSEFEAANSPGTDTGDSNASVTPSDMLLDSPRGVQSKWRISSVDLPWADKPRAPVGMPEFNCIISACALAGDLDRAFQTYDEACGRLGLTRDGDTLNALLLGCVQMRHLRGAGRIVEELRKEGLIYNTETLMLTVRFFLRGQRNVDAFELLRDAVDKGAHVPARAFHLVARHFANSGMLDSAHECVNLAVKAGYRREGVQPRQKAYHDYDRGLGSHGGENQDEMGEVAERNVKEMEKEHSESDVENRLA